MSRDGSGNYLLPNADVLTGTVITTTWANSTMADIATEMQDSLSRSGKGGMTAAFKNFDGTVSLPGITWVNETSSGFYRSAAGVITASILGNNVARFNAADKFQVYDGAAWQTVWAEGANVVSLVIEDTSADHQYTFTVNELAGNVNVELPLLAASDVFVFEAYAQTLTNKTLTAPVMTDPVMTAPQINDTSADHQYIVNPSELLADRTVTLPLLTGNDEFTFNDHTQTLTNKTLTSPTVDTPTVNDPTLTGAVTEEVFAVTGTTPALSPGNGTIQTWTLSGASTPTVGTWAAGQSMTLMVDDGTAYAITWTTVNPTWVNNGGAAPTLATTGYTVIVLWKVGSTIYGALVGDGT